MSKCCQTKAKQQRDTEKPKSQAARQMTELHGLPPDTFEEVGAIVRYSFRKLEIPVGPAMPCVKQIRIPTAKPLR